MTAISAAAATIFINFCLNLASLKFIFPGVGIAFGLLVDSVSLPVSGAAQHGNWLPYRRDNHSILADARNRTARADVAPATTHIRTCFREYNGASLVMASVLRLL